MNIKYVYINNYILRANVYKRIIYKNCVRTSIYRVYRVSVIEILISRVLRAAIRTNMYTFCVGNNMKVLFQRNCSPHYRVHARNHNLLCTRG